METRWFGKVGMKNLPWFWNISHSIKQESIYIFDWFNSSTFTFKKDKTEYISFLTISTMWPMQLHMDMPNRDLKQYTIIIISSDIF